MQRTLRKCPHSQAQDFPRWGDARGGTQGAQCLHDCISRVGYPHFTASVWYRQATEASPHQGEGGRLHPLKGVPECVDSP